MKIRKYVVKMIIIVLLVGCLGMIPNISVCAESKTPSLSNKKVTLIQGKTKVVRLKKVSQKVKWKILSGKKVIKIVNKSGKYKNTVKMRGIKEGKSVLQAKCGKKTYEVEVIVKKAYKVALKNKKAEPKTEKPKEEVTRPPLTPIAPEEKYATITFNSLGGTPVESIKLKIGELYGELPRPEREGYVFFGWKKKPNADHQIREIDSCTGDITLYAEFVPKSEIEYENCTKVYFYENEESEATAYLWIEYGKTFDSKLPVLSKAGYKFLGWYTWDGREMTWDTICPQEWNLRFYARFRKY